MKSDAWYRRQARAQADATEIRIDAAIGQEPGQVSARWFRSQLPTDGRPIRISIHSEGGVLFEAFGIVDAIAAYPGPKTAVVESMALSAASLILCVCDSVEATPNAYCMIHTAHFDRDEPIEQSERDLLRSLRARMVSLYWKKTNKPTAVIEKALDSEVFYDAEAAQTFGLVDRITGKEAAPARRRPAMAVARARSPQLSAVARWKAAVDAAGSVSAANKKNPGLRQQMLDEVNRR